MEICEQIKLLNNLGVGKKTIARQLGISKNTVKNYLEKEETTHSQVAEQEQRLSDLHSFFNK